MFDDLILLSKGRLVYCGAANEAADYFMSGDVQTDKVLPRHSMPQKKNEDGDDKDDDDDHDDDKDDDDDECKTRGEGASERQGLLAGEREGRGRSTTTGKANPADFLLDYLSSHSAKSLDHRWRLHCWQQNKKKKKRKKSSDKLNTKEWPPVSPSSHYLLSSTPPDLPGHTSASDQLMLVPQCSTRPPWRHQFIACACTFVRSIYIYIYMLLLFLFVGLCFVHTREREEEKEKRERERKTMIIFHREGGRRNGHQLLLLGLSVFFPFRPYLFILPSSVPRHRLFFLNLRLILSTIHYQPSTY